MKVNATGRLISRSAVEQHGEFRKRTIVIECQDGQYTNQYAFELVQDNTDIANGFAKDQMVTVMGFVNCREGSGNYAGKWFTNLRATSVHPAQAAATAAPAPQPAASYQAPAPAQNVSEQDEIPF